MEFPHVEAEEAALTVGHAPLGRVLPTTQDRTLLSQTGPRGVCLHLHTVLTR